MNQKNIYNIIRSWEVEIGEGFFEYFGDYGHNINTCSLMFWLYGKGYINIEKINLYEKECDNSDKNNSTPSAYDCLCAYETNYSLFPYGECDKEANLKGELIVAEFIAENIIYEQRLKCFAFEGKGWASFDTEEDKTNHYNNMIKCANRWTETDEAEYQKIIQLNVNDINERLNKEYNSNK